MRRGDHDDRVFKNPSRKSLQKGFHLFDLEEGTDFVGRSVLYDPSPHQKFDLLGPFPVIETASQQAGYK